MSRKHFAKLKNDTSRSLRQQQVRHIVINVLAEHLSATLIILAHLKDMDVICIKKHETIVQCLEVSLWSRVA